MLGYLIPSQSRRALLRLLFVEERRESVSKFAELASVGFSTAYEELRAMEHVGLAKSEYQGNRVLFHANSDAPHFTLVKSLLQTDKQQKEQPPTEAVMANLERMSGALGTHASNQPELSNEETLVLAFKFARYNATVARVLPVALYKNFDHLNFEKLKTLCFKAGEKKTFGFFLDLTSELANSTRLHELAEEFHDRRCKKSQSFFVNQPQGKYAKRLEAKNTPALAKRWQFRMNMDLENFRSHFEKFVTLEQTRENLR
jgi:hypothetical protein